VALLVLVVACTQEPASDGSSTPTTPPTRSPSVEPTGTTLADGSPLPSGCTGGAGDEMTVAFVAEGRAWSLDPHTDQVACLFPVQDPGPFAWGPQGDRVLLGGFEIHGLGGDAPDLPPIQPTATAFDWGHPLGLAVAFADEDGRPFKRYTDDGSVKALSRLPSGTYLQVAYHPSGLALAFVVEDDEGQAIWLSTNEGEDPQRLVFSATGTQFPSIGFTPNGKQLWWTARHAEGFSALHWMNLDDRTGFGNSWRGEPGSFATDLRFAPEGSLTSIDEGETCGDRRALIVSRNSAVPALPNESRPTHGLGWLDATTLLVAAGGCDDPLDLFAVDATGATPPAALVFGVDLAAARTKVLHPPTEVPTPASEPPISGVG
jgi:hypothetical protein